MNYFCMHFQRTMCRGQRLAVPESQDGNELWEKSEISDIAYSFVTSQLIIIRTCPKMTN